MTPQHRPNVDLRRVPPLDPFERALRDDPKPVLPPPDGISVKAWLWVAGCAVAYGVIWWWRG